MNSLSSLLAGKYLQFKNKDRNIALMIKVCFLGILIGTFSLMLTLIIMNGFEKVIHEKMQGINSQAIIYSSGQQIDNESIKSYLNEKFKNKIKALSGSSTRQVLIDYNNNQSVLFIKGVDNDFEKTTNITEKIISPQNVESFFNLIKENKIIIGNKMAQTNNLKVGDILTLLIPKAGGKDKINLKKKKLEISGIFKIGLEEYDNNFAFCSLGLLQDLFKENKQGVDQINLNFKKSKEPNFFKKIYNFFSFKDYEQRTIDELQKDLPTLTISSWKDFYPALVASLKLEKYVMFFILALITLVASMTMVSLLFMYIQQKRRDIAILKSMGLSNKNIRSIFLNIGLKLTFWSSSAGLALAAIAGFILERYPFINLPDVYYVSYLPARMDLEIFIIVFVCTMILGFFATWIPARRTKQINIAQVLRQE
ncbi:MAG: FtsX-like permease family protein [bacterium]